MRILIVNLHFAPDSYGGATVIAEEEATALAEAGHEVVVFTGTRDARIGRGELFRYQGNGLPVLAVGLPGYSDDEELHYENETIAGRFAEVLRVVQPDVVHFHAVQHLGVGCVEASLAAGITTVVTLHDAWWFCERQFMIREDGRFCGQVGIQADVCATCVPDPVAHVRRQQRSADILNSCDAVLVPSEYWARVMIGSGVDGSILRVNRNGVTQPRKGFQRPPYRGPVRFGFVGGRGPLKGGDQVLAALASLPRDDYVLKVVDGSKNLGRSSMRVSHWTVPGTVELVPGWTRDGLDEFFGGIDVLLFPSQWRESFGLTVREATLRGVWCIVTEGGGASEDIVDGGNGTVIPLNGRHEELAAAINEILDDPGRFTPDPSCASGIRSSAEQAAEVAAILEQCVTSARAGSVGAMDDEQPSPVADIERA